MPQLTISCKNVPNLQLLQVLAAATALMGVSCTATHYPSTTRGHGYTPVPGQPAPAVQSYPHSIGDYFRAAEYNRAKGLYAESRWEPVIGDEIGRGRYERARAYTEGQKANRQWNMLYGERAAAERIRNARHMFWEGRALVNDLFR